MKTNRKTELCANTIDDIIAVKNLPFTSIELNSGIEVDGLTPSLSFLKAARNLTDAELHCMIRPRAGGFCYSEALYQQMKEDAKAMLENGTDGIVFGFLKEDGTLDEARCEEFVHLAHSCGKKATFHKAIDVAENREEALRFLQKIQMDRILTSPANVPLFQPYCQGIELVAGGGVTSRNVKNLVSDYGITSLHFTAKQVMQDNFGKYCCVDIEEAKQIFAQLEK